MTPDDVKKRVAGIAAQAEHDEEAAHGDEDELLADVLRHISESSSDHTARELATEALAATKLNYDRWYA